MFGATGSSGRQYGERQRICGRTGITLKAENVVKIAWQLLLKARFTKKGYIHSQSLGYFCEHYFFFHFPQPFSLMIEEDAASYLFWNRRFVVCLLTML